jgi:hypothetical protein
MHEDSVQAALTILSRAFSKQHMRIKCAVAYFRSDLRVTSSTAWGFNEKNLRLLASCEKVLICFDADKNQAGDKASKRWLDRLSNAVRWRPLWDDANDMAMDGVDVGEWLALGFQLSSQDQPDREIIPVPYGLSMDSSLPKTLIEETTLCFVCLNEDRETPASFIGPEDIMYCKTHYGDLPSEIRRADMEALAERYRQAFPGWKVSVEARSTCETPWRDGSRNASRAQ